MQASEKTDKHSVSVAQAARICEKNAETKKESPETWYLRTIKSERMEDRLHSAGTASDRFHPSHI